MISAREYQETGIDFLLKRKKAMCSDAPGLGKTFQATEAIERANAYPALIIPPAFLVKQWAEFIKAQYPHRTVSYAKRADFYLRDWALSIKADYYIANVEMLRNVDDYAWPNDIKAIVFDEAHHLKNRNSKQSQGAMKLVIGNKAEYVFCLSATPIKREADDLFAQLRLLRPDIFTSYSTFVNTFCEVEQTPWELKVLGIRDKESLLKLLELVMIRREYSDVSMQLPELIETIIPIEFNEKQRKAYETLRDDLILRCEGVDEEIPYMWAIQALQTLRKMTGCDEKIDAVVSLAQEEGIRPVIFTHYKELGRKIATKLGVPLISGDVPALERPELAKAQQICVATIDSLTEGVDLSMFDTIIFAEEDYTPGVNYQALSRVRRFGARIDRPIIKYCVHVSGTIDEHIHNVSERRDVTAQDLLKDVLGFQEKRAAGVA